MKTKMHKITINYISLKRSKELYQKKKKITKKKEVSKGWKI
jgi:hypothetical protein